MRVLKFGGTSVADAQRLKLVSDIVQSKQKKHKSLCVVVSAFSGMTDLLLQTVNFAQSNETSYKDTYDQFILKVHDVAQELLGRDTYSSIKTELDDNHVSLQNLLAGVALIQEASPKTKDYVVSFGERNCAFLLATYLQMLGHKSAYIDARKVIKTDGSYGSAIVDFELTTPLIKKHLSDKDTIYIATGFIGSEKISGVTTTLGRGGSDYSAAIFAAALDASALEIWTDVDGVLTSDPRKVKKAYSITELSYLEAAEMSHFGAKVLYAPTIRPVKEKNIPTIIKNTFNPEHPGTLIHHEAKDQTGIISGLSSINNVTLVSLQGSGMQGVPGIAYRLFKCIADGQINVIMITQASSEHSICIAISDNDEKSAESHINKEFELEIQRRLIDLVKLRSGLCLLAVIGENMKNSPGVAGKLFETLGKNGINVEAIAQGSSELNITFAVAQEDESQALNAVHDAFFLSEYKTVHLFVVGIGLIGSTLIRQMINNHDSIRKNSKVELVINGISNSKKMLFSEDGVSMDNFKEQLEHSQVSAGIEKFIDRMIQMNFAHSIFVDNTASKVIPEHYSRIMENNIAISTPNKIALSSGMSQYKKLKALSGAMNIPLNFETNVGAGLPVISTLKSLTMTGDKISKIQAVLSGSVSYIFNNFTSNVDFMDLVKEAQEKGLTEPDPREDLSGADVKRKMLILARESGFDVEDEDIEIKSLLSDACINADSVDDFYKELEKDTPRYKEMILKAEAAEEHLRFIASYENGRGTISLQSVDSQNPFYGLSGSDNMIVIHSSRYNDTPLVIRGPGAGAEVTAAGLLAEILSMSSVL